MDELLFIIRVDRREVRGEKASDVSIHIVTPEELNSLDTEERNELMHHAVKLPGKSGSQIYMDELVPAGESKFILIKGTNVTPRWGVQWEG